MDSTVYKVYWSKVGINFKLTPMTKDFTKTEMADAIKFMESLRKQQREGGHVRHVVMSCEHPESVGNPGVDVTGPEYNWKKRRV